MEFKCPRCDEIFKRKDYLTSHLKRRLECAATSSNESRQSIIDKLTTKEYNEKTYDCEFCKKKFNQPSCKSRHRKICKKNPINIHETDEASTSNTQNEASTSNTHNKVSTSNIQNEESTYQIVVDKTEFENMKLKMQYLEEQLMALSANKASSTNHVSNTTTNNNTTNNNTININLNSFGNENISHLTKEFLSYCILNPKKGMASLIESIHYNKSIPENQNLRCKSLKQNIFEKYTEDEWRACDASNTLDELIKKGYKILNAHYTDNIINLPDYYDNEIKQRAYEQFRFLGDVHCIDYFAVKRELRILIKDRTMYLLAPPDERNDIMNASADE